MKRSRIIAIALFGLFLLPLLFVQAQDQKEKRASELIADATRQLRNVKDVQARRRAVEECLLLCRSVDNIGHELALISLKDPDDEVRLKSAQALAALGPKAGTGRTAAVPYLVDRLKKEKEPAIRLEVIAALGSIFFGGCHPAQAKQPVAQLVNAMQHDEDTHVRWAACRSLRMFGSRSAKDAAPALLEAMKDKDDGQLREFARLSFSGVAGPECKDLTPTLIEMFKNRENDAETEFTILEALGTIGAQEDMVVPLLIDALKGKGVKHARSRGAAAGALGWLGPKAKTAVPALTEAFETGIKKKDGLWGFALFGLERIGPDAASALPVLRRAANDANLDESARRAVKDALVRMQK